MHVKDKEYIEALYRLKLLQADPQAGEERRTRAADLIAELGAIKVAQAAAVARVMRLRKALAEIEADRKAALAEAALLLGPQPRKRSPARHDNIAQIAPLKLIKS